MGRYTIQALSVILQAESRMPQPDAVVEYLLTDSRRIAFPQRSLFIALKTSSNDGHRFVQDAFDKGVPSFIVEKNFDTALCKGANFLLVSDPLAALQAIAAYHRQQFSYPVVGITGSNGKTVVKEWCHQLLSPDYAMVRSPRSYNSQTGVAISVWQMEERHQLAVFEAGISLPGEMARLETMIRPGIGILTHMGDAHREGFGSDREKALEKLQLFRHSQLLIFCGENLLQAGVDLRGGDRHLLPRQLRLLEWSRACPEADLLVVSETRNNTFTHIHLRSSSGIFDIAIPFTDKASVDNALSCCCLLLHLNIAPAVIRERMLQLQPVEMRLQLVKGINNCYILNDAYSNDLSSLGIALDHLVQQAGTHPKTVILSDMLQSGLPDEQLYPQIAAELLHHSVARVICIGSKVALLLPLLQQSPQQPVTEYFAATGDFLRQVTTHHFRDEYILLKGARIFAFERISSWLEQQVHQTVMEINLSALVYNVKQYQQQLRPGVKLMAMVKAFGYGSGSAEVANILQFHKVDYLAVAYADEGVELRKAGIRLPILILNVDEAAFEVLVQYNLEPELYSFRILHAFLYFLRQQGLQQFPVHLKIDTGMHRLGFAPAELHEVGVLLHQQPQVRVQSVFSHLAASEDPAEDAFTELQASFFLQGCTLLQQYLGYSFLRHLSNTAAVFRLPELQYEMVRVGIGMYGVDSAKNDHRLHLQTVATLKTTIAQLRRVKAGDTIGYNRRGKVTRDSVIATIRIGYADGYSRRLGNGVGKVWIKGHLLPVIGSVCMDMTMVDATDCPDAREGDTVELFGTHIPVQQVAEWSGTIAYEVLTDVGQRVKRIYYEE